MEPAIVGTLVITGGAALMAVPLGILGAIYLNEYGKQGRLARVIRFLAEVMTGVPSIVMGLFIYVVWVLHFKNQTAFAGSLALACLMLPIVIRTSEEILQLVPDELREGSYALGSRKVRTIRTVVLPHAAPGIVSGALLAVARAAGETAPLLFTIGIVTSTNLSLFHGPNDRALVSDLPPGHVAVHRRPRPGLRRGADLDPARLRVHRPRPPRHRVVCPPSHRRSLRWTSPTCAIPRHPPLQSTPCSPGPRPSRVDAAAKQPGPFEEPTVVFDLADVEVLYHGTAAIEQVNLQVQAKEITAFIGPSGCGKTTILRTMNRMHDITPGAEVRGRITYHGEDLYSSHVDVAEVRRRIGMVFQKPNPFPKSIQDNVAYGPRINGRKRGDLGDLVEHALQQAALWDEVKDKLKQSALGLSGGQQQRLCIARALAVQPDVVLMDEPCASLDPIATARIEDLMQELKSEYTLVIVTHNMQQAARASDRTAFFTAEVDDGRRVGRLVEMDNTEQLFTQPSDPRTEGYITGRFG